MYPISDWFHRLILIIYLDSVFTCSTMCGFYIACFKYLNRTLAFLPYRSNIMLLSLSISVRDYTLVLPLFQEDSFEHNEMPCVLIQGVEVTSGVLPVRHYYYFLCPTDRDPMMVQTKRISVRDPPVRGRVPFAFSAVKQ